MKVLVTGADGQLGKCLADLVNKPRFLTTNPSSFLELHFADKSQLDITDVNSCEAMINEDFDFVINAAAFTAVDAAEDNQDVCQKVNVSAIYHLANICNAKDIHLVHISSDYVFDGRSFRPYIEEDKTLRRGTTDTLNSHYAETKVWGEQLIRESSKEHGLNATIIRTSWLFSPYRNNFVKTMLRLQAERSELGVVCDQIGSPTSAHYLADFILTILPLLQFKENHFNIFHYANSGVASWYDLAMAINELTQSKCIIRPIPTSSYPTKAKRPHYSVLSTEKIQSQFCLSPPKHWRIALAETLDLVTGGQPC